MSIMSDGSLCDQMNNTNLATSNETDNDASDSILDSEDDNNNRIEDVNNIDDINVSTQKFNELNEEHQLFKKETDELLNRTIPLVQLKKRNMVKEAFNLLLNGVGELPISMISM